MDTTPQPTPGIEPRTDGKAIWSLVCGILSITCFWILAGIPAIVLGHMSRSSIRTSRGRLKGEGMALAGLVMGYISVALLPILIIAAIAIPSLLRSRQVANETTAIRNLRTITIAEETFHSSNGRYGDMQSLISERLLDDSLRRVEAGYSFRIENAGDDYTVTATPATPNTGRYEYFSTSDRVIHYSRDSDLAPPGLAGEPIELTLSR
jgi:type II secretory pathway pseudopilin PulG